MFVLKKKYFFIVENIKNINLDNIKNINKFNIIYRSNKIKDKTNELLRFREKCKRKRITFYVANHLKLFRSLKADGLYISAYNKSFKYRYLKNLKGKIIGSAHNISEIALKKNQGCSIIFLSRLFKTNYKNKETYLGLIRYNLHPFKNILSPLGGINRSNLNYLKNIKSDSLALSSAFVSDDLINKLFY